jgi:anti-anti-sigma factor
VTANPAFDITVEGGPPGSERRALVAVTGEIDVATAPDLGRTLSELVEEGRNELTVDLAGVAFIDASGIGTLVGAARRARLAGGSVILRTPSGAVRRMLVLAGLDGSLRVDS